MHRLQRGLRLGDGERGVGPVELARPPHLRAQVEVEGRDEHGAYDERVEHDAQGHRHPQLGVAVALGVILDTMIVRSVLVTAINMDLGGTIWWPSKLDRADAPPTPAEVEAPLDTVH